MRRWGRNARRARSGVVLLALTALFGSCGVGGELGSGTDVGSGTLPPPASIALATENGGVLVDWTPVAGAASYTVYWSLSPGVTPATGAVVQAGTPPVALENPPGGATLVLVMTSTGADGQGPPSPPQSIAVAPGGAEAYFPPWWDAVPLDVITLDYDAGQSSAQNGAVLKGLMQSLQPGDRLEIGGGLWTLDSYVNLSLVGSASAPIRIAAQAGETPVLTRSDAAQNTLNLGAGGSPARYLCLEGLEIRGGDIALRLEDCAHVWVDSCHVHDCAANAIAANSDPVDHLYLTRNDVHGTGGTGEGFYIGGNFSDPVAHDCVIALNHVHDTAGSQGDGIELKQGSWGNRIAENYVHDTPYPCILVYGTDGNPPNLVERNVCVGSGDNVMQVQGEATVRNNVIVGGANGFYSGDHQGETRDLVVVHNTIVNAGTAARLQDWNDRPGMVFANNACVSQSGDAILFASGSSGVAIAGNVVFGPVIGATGGYALGGGLADFVGADWDGVPVDVTPAPGSALVGAGDAGYGVLLDVAGSLRLPALEAGAVDQKP